MTALYALALAGLVTGLALAVRLLLRARRQALTAAPSRPALGPYRVAREEPLAHIQCTASFSADPARVMALTPEQRERLAEAIADEAIRTAPSREQLVSGTRRELAKLVAAAGGEAAKGDAWT